MAWTVKDITPTITLPQLSQNDITPTITPLHTVTLPTEVFIELHEKAVKYDILKRDCTYPTSLEKVVYDIDEQKDKEQPGKRKMEDVL